MRYYTVKQVAKLSGVTVRTLHHYDRLGLLRPAKLGENGYRYYGREELLRLQQILFHRELEFPLEAIAEVLSQPDFDRVEALRRHRETLAQKARRYRRLIKTLDQTLAALQGGFDVDDHDLYAGFSPEKQADYEGWLVDRLGDAARPRIEATKKAMKAWSKTDWARFRAECAEVEAGVANALADGLPADSDAVRALIRRHHAWVALSWSRPPERAAYIGLGRLYLDHPDFRARYDGLRPGLTEYLAEAMRQFAERELA